MIWLYLPQGHMQLMGGRYLPARKTRLRFSQCSNRRAPVTSASTPAIRTDHTVRFGPIGGVCRLLGLRWRPRSQASRVREDGPGRGHRSPRVWGRARSARTLRFQLYLSPARHLLRPREFFLRPGTSPRSFVFAGKFTIPASEP